MNAVVAVCALSLASLVGVLPAIAEDDNLPGVSKKSEPIVTTLPPEPTENGDDPQSFRIGNTDVRISGEITIDVVTGDIKPSLHR